MVGSLLPSAVLLLLAALAANALQPTNSSSDEEVQVLRHFRGPVSARQQWLENPERWRFIDDGQDKKLQHVEDSQRAVGPHARGNSPTLTREQEIEADYNFSRIARENASKDPDRAAAWENLAKVHERRADSKKEEIEKGKRDAAEREQKRARLAYFREHFKRKREEKKKKKAESDGDVDKNAKNGEEQEKKRTSSGIVSDQSDDSGSAASAPDRLERSPFKKKYEGKGKGPGKGKSSQKTVENPSKINDSDSGSDGSSSSSNTGSGSSGGNTSAPTSKTGEDASKTGNVSPKGGNDSPQPSTSGEPEKKKPKKEKKKKKRKRRGRRSAAQGGGDSQFLTVLLGYICGPKAEMWVKVVRSVFRLQCPE